jgi:hypothetical protein
MQSHKDAEHRFLQKLEGRAELAVAAGASEITGGKPNEPELSKWQASGVYVVKRPDDSQGILRISVGGHDSFSLNYCTFRGDKEKCIKLLQLAIAALRREPGEKS